MLLGVKSRSALLARHTAMGGLSVLTVYLFFVLRSGASLDIRIWRALGDSTFIFLFITMIIGPISILWKPASRLVSWRREFGIWFTLLGLAHFLRVLDFALSDPSVWFPSVIGAVALSFALALAITSSDRAVSFLGVSSWKWLHSFAYVIFYLSSMHVVYFLFFYSGGTNPLKYIFLFIILTVPLLQATAFVKIVTKQRRGANGVSVGSNFIKVPIIERKLIAEKTNEVSFDLSHSKFMFTAGQYVQMRIPKLLYQDDKGSSRTFSVVSSPNNKDKISFAFRDSGSGFKRTLLEMPIGSVVEIEGPLGFFTLPKDKSQEVVFIAGGIGITPYMSMIRFATENNLENKITLLYSNASKENASYLSELEKIEKENELFYFKNKFGYIDEDFIKKSVQNIENKIWYVVGPPPMVAALRDVLFKIGVDSGKIRFEDFYGY